MILGLSVACLGYSFVALPGCGLGKRALEAALGENLRVVRQVIGEFEEQKGRLPTSMQELIDAGYLRQVPVDPITRSSETWILEYSTEPGPRGLSGVRSGAIGEALDGTPFSSW